MKAAILKIAVFLFCLTGLIGCNFSSSSEEVNVDSLRADSLWRVAIADSINNVRNTGVSPSVTDTSLSDLETITRGMTEGLNKVQEGLNKVRKVKEVSANSAKAITDGVNKTKEAVNKTIEEAKRTISGEPAKEQ